MPSELTFKPMGTRVKTRKELERVADIDPRLTRSNYFDNKLLTAEDLNRDQLYIDGRLREVGQTIGYGILEGLDISLDDRDGSITVSPGVAMSAAGRVLELGRELAINLSDRAYISELNQGKHRRLNRSIYAVILRYAEVGADISEVFPTNLADKRGFQYDIISEGVQLGLVRLPLPLAQQHPLYIRANLMRELYSDNTANGSIPEDGVALGVLAISNDKPQWLDAELLRQPLRTSSGAEDLQLDLSRRYQSLFDDVMEERRSRSLEGDFAATDYFSLLPPVGSLPKKSIDPVAGRQGFFPDDFQVWTAPVRKSEVALITKESMVLPPIDLSLKEPMDIIVLAPLSNADYGRYAKGLERPFNSKTRRLSGMDLLKLRLYPRRPVHEIDTDESTWQAIWDTVNEEELIYIRRPLRAAETHVSAIVLAQGTEMPEAPAEPPPPTPSDGGLLQDEDSVFLNRINFKYMGRLRTPQEAEGRTAFEDISSQFGEDAEVVLNCLTVLLRVEPAYNEVIWQSLFTLAERETLEKFRDVLLEHEDKDVKTGEIVIEAGEEFGLDDELLSKWKELIEK